MDGLLTSSRAGGSTHPCTIAPDVLTGRTGWPVRAPARAQGHTHLPNMRRPHHAVILHTHTHTHAQSGSLQAKPDVVSRLPVQVVTAYSKL